MAFLHTRTVPYPRARGDCGSSVAFQRGTSLADASPARTGTCTSGTLPRRRIFLPSAQERQNRLESNDQGPVRNRNPAGRSPPSGRRSRIPCRPERIRARRLLDQPDRGVPMSLLIGSMTIGFILALLAFGVFISFRIFAFPDITAEGSITLGAATAATLLVGGFSPLIATLAGFAAGMLAGAATGLLHTRFNINGLLAGILVMTA